MTLFYEEGEDRCYKPEFFLAFMSFYKCMAKID